MQYTQYIGRRRRRHDNLTLHPQYIGRRRRQNTYKHNALGDGDASTTIWHYTRSTLGDGDAWMPINAIHSASQTLRHYKYNTITVSASILKIHCVSLTNLICQTHRHYTHNSFHVISRIGNSRTTPAIHLGCQTLRHFKYSDLAVSDAHALRI